MGGKPEGDHHIQHGKLKVLRGRTSVLLSFQPQVEDFWALYNHIELASRLAAGCDYSLFKEGVKPMWEDERFANQEVGEQPGLSNISLGTRKEVGG